MCCPDAEFRAIQIRRNPPHPPRLRFIPMPLEPHGVADAVVGESATPNQTPRLRTRLAAAARRARLHALTLADLHRRLVIDGGRAHPLLDLTRHGQEGLLDVRCVLCRRLQEGNPQAVGKLLRKELADGRLESELRPTFATVYSTTFLSDISLLLPTSSLLTPSVA